VMIRFRSGIPELSETGIGRNSVRFRNYNFHYYCIISYPSSDECEGEGVRVWVSGCEGEGEDSTCDIVQFGNRPESPGISSNSASTRFAEFRRGIGSIVDR
jgi:hypothetical protein